MTSDGENYPVPSKGYFDNSMSKVHADNGDVFIGEKKVYNMNLSPPQVNPKNILILVSKYKDLDCEDPEFLAIKEELDDYNKPRPDRPVVGLEGKLTQGNRLDLFSDARFQKDKFAKRLSRYEFSTHHCAIHLNLLSRIEEKFNSKIKPLIEAEMSSEEIDFAISVLIVEPLAEEVSPADPTITAKIIRGMIFLLTGNCYLRWNHNDSISSS